MTRSIRDDDQVLLTWQNNGRWQFDPDPAQASEIEARFGAVGPEKTIVDVEHRHFERLVAGQGVPDAINGGRDWERLLAGYAKTTVAQP